MASPVPLVLVLQEIHRRKKREELRNIILSLNVVPSELFEMPNTVEGLLSYVKTNDRYGKFSEENAGKFVSDLATGHQHKDVHCISCLQVAYILFSWY